MLVAVACGRSDDRNANPPSPPTVAVAVDAAPDAYEAGSAEIQRAASSEPEARKLEAKIATDRAAGLELRRAFVRSIEQQNDGSLPLRFALGDDDRDLVVTATNGACSRQLLDEVTKLSGEPMRRAKFRRLVCAGTAIAADL